MVRGGRAEAPGPRSDVSFRLDQQTANFKVAFASRQMQWSLTEEKQNNQLAQTEFRFIKTIKVIKRGGGGEGGGAITCHDTGSPSPLRCTAAKDGKLQGDHSEQSNAVESIH